MLTRYVQIIDNTQLDCTLMITLFFYVANSGHFKDAQSYKIWITNHITDMEEALSLSLPANDQVP